ncbi:unnamed protein product [Lathyrus oleraceus]|nr:uncharacterized protein LOC127119069 isoform X2 [Pisum sativum]
MKCRRTKLRIQFRHQNPIRFGFAFIFTVGIAKSITEPTRVERETERHRESQTDKLMKVEDLPEKRFDTMITGLKCPMAFVG